jgi:tellurite resistance protein TehA-like permease
MSDLGRMLIVMGIVILVVGVVLLLAGRVSGVGRLPGDIYVERAHWTFYFPLGTSIVLSLLLTLVLWLIGRR